MDPDVITLDSDSETECDESLITISSPAKGVIISLPGSSISPKIQPKPAHWPSLITKLNGVNNTNSTEIEEITIDSDDDDGEAKPGPSVPLPSVCKRQLNGSIKVNVIKRNGSIIKDETEDEDAQQVLNNEDDKDNAVGSDDFQSDAATNITNLLQTIQHKLTKAQQIKATRKFWNAYNKLNEEPLTVHSELAKRIAATTKKIKEDSGTKEDIPLRFWKYLLLLLDQFDATKLRDGEDFMAELDGIQPDPVKNEELKKKKILKMEKLLNKISEKIKELDEQEVDWDAEDDHNSSYCLRDRYMKKYNDQYKLICKTTKSSKLTGRPVQKSISIKNITPYPELERAVEKSVNSKGYLFAPDFWNVQEVVKAQSAQDGLHLADADLNEIAITLHKEVIKTIKGRREKDVLLAFPPSCDSAELIDPADADPELAKRLEENLRNAHSVNEVVDEFVRRQQEGNFEPQEIDDAEENIDRSPAASDTEEGDNDEEDSYDAGSLTGSTFESNGVEDDGTVDIEAGYEPLYDEEDEDDEGTQEDEDDGTDISVTATNIAGSSSKDNESFVEVLQPSISEAGIEIEDGAPVEITLETDSVLPQPNVSPENGSIDTLIVNGAEESNGPPTKRQRLEPEVDTPTCPAIQV